MDDLTKPPTEIEIAEAIKCCGTIGSKMIRRLAFERDAIKGRRKEMEQALISGASSIIDNWDDWDGEAQQAAQIDQDERSWRHVMLTHIVSRMWREFGWPLREVE